MITMTSLPHLVTKILKETKAHFWKDVKVNDILIFSFPMKENWRSSSGLHATYVNVDNKTNSTTGSLSLSDMKYLNYLELEELNADYSKRRIKEVV